MSDDSGLAWFGFWLMLAILGAVDMWTDTYPQQCPNSEIEQAGR